MYSLPSTDVLVLIGFLAASKLVEPEPPGPSTGRTGTVGWSLTKFGKPLAIAEGYDHVLNAISRVDPNLSFHHCVDKRTLGCHGIIHIIGNTYRVVSEHNHTSVSQEAALNAAKMKETIRNGAATSDNISKLVNDAYDFLHPDEKALAVKKSSLHRMARNIKNKGAIKLPKEPEELDDLGKCLLSLSSPLLSLSFFLSLSSHYV